MKKILVIFLVIITIKNVVADNYPTGADNLAVANSTVAVPTLWSVYHNQAALAYLKGTQAGIYYENRFSMPEFAVKSLAVATNIKPGTIGFALTSFGFSKFSDNKIGLAYSMKLAKYISVGIQIDYFLIHQESYYGNLGTVAAEIGIFANPFENFYIGAHIFNPWRAKISSYQDERLPTVFRMGIAYDFSKQVKYSLEVEKNLDLPAFFKTGVSYEPIKNLFLRTGISVNKNNVSSAFGLGYIYQNISFDIAFENTPLLGMKTGIDICFRFK
jgi:hypothetical protein